jgi:hypothetical protein
MSEHGAAIINGQIAVEQVSRVVRDAVKSMPNDEFRKALFAAIRQHLEKLEAELIKPRS